MTYIPTPLTIKRQVDKIVGYLIEIGLAGDQNFAVHKAMTDGYIEITFPQAKHVSISLKDRSYNEIYAHLVRERAYNAKMPDGALIQMMYLFNDSILKKHRLTFFPAPHLEDFQKNPEIYLEDELYADVIARNIVPFPLRFDYVSNEANPSEVDHPKTHLTLGEYKNCRMRRSGFFGQRTGIYKCKTAQG